MADEQRPSGPPGGKRRRPATIDLKATEVTPEPVQPPQSADAPPEAAPPEVPPATVSTAAEPASEPPQEPAAAEPTMPAEERPDASPGEVIALGTAGLTVKCGEDAVRLTMVQPAGKARMSPADWARGRGVELGDVFG